MTALRYPNVIFDLDGTVVDSFPGIHNSLNHAMESVGHPPLPEALAKKFIGPQLADSLRNFLGFEDVLIEKTVNLYRDRYAVTGLYESAPYPLIPELIRDLKDSGAKVFMATAKPTVYARQMLSFHRLEGEFLEIHGCNDLKEKHHDKSVSIASIISKHLCPPDQTVMVGDTFVDIHAAHQSGISSIAVTYGFGLPEDLQKAGPTHFAHSVSEVKAIVEKGSS